MAKSGLKAGTKVLVTKFVDEADCLFPVIEGETILTIQSNLGYTYIPNNDAYYTIEGIYIGLYDEVEELTDITFNNSETTPEMVNTTKESRGKKNDQDKPDLSLIPTDALWGIASALTYGAKKYQRHNFRSGIAYSRLVAATMRHLSAWNEGQNLDSETNLSHLDHAMASLAMLKFMEVNRPEMDDRYKKDSK